MKNFGDERFCSPALAKALFSRNELSGDVGLEAPDSGSKKVEILIGRYEKTHSRGVVEREEERTTLGLLM